MKKVIVFASNDYSDTPYGDWFSREDVTFLFLTSAAFREKYELVGECIDINQGDETFSLNLVERLKAFAADIIYARNERDVLPAAYLRCLLNIKGQCVNSAQAYRNKFVMKNLIRESNIALPDYRLLRRKEDMNLISFAMPWVFKPLDDSGSGGVAVIHEAKEIGQNLNFPILAESFVSGHMYHIDGLAKDGDVIWSHASAYLQGCLAFKDNTYAGSITLSEEFELTQVLLQQAKSVINLLPPAGLHVFHAEFFIDDKGLPVFCEIASRTPGGRIKQFIKVATGVDLDQLCLNGLLDIHSIQGPVTQRSNPKPTGWLLIYPKIGRLITLDGGKIHAAICDEKLHGKVGADYFGGEKSGRGLWSCVYQAESQDQLEPIAMDIYRQFSEKAIWSLSTAAKESA